MRREQMRKVLLVVVAVHLLAGAVFAWLLVGSDLGSPLSRPSSSARKAERAAGVPKSEQKSEQRAVVPEKILPKTTAPKKEPVVLRETIVLPTLDTPIPAGKSAVWCASFQMAWDRLREDFVREPIRLEGAVESVNRLNRNPFPAEAITPKNTYAVAGRYEDGIVKKVRGEIARNFPDANLPPLEEFKAGVLAFAYLQSKVRFPVPYLNHPKGIEFHDSSGHSRRVAAFGFSVVRDPYGELEVLGKLKQQAMVLHVELNDREQPKTFAIDPCRSSSPDQVVLARIDRKGTLAEMLADTEKKIASFPAGAEKMYFIPEDAVWMPVLSLDVEHRFRELEGRNGRLLNERMRGVFLTTALQTVRFKLDANGAELASMARIRRVKSADRSPQNLTFDRSFLIYAKKRDGKQPFLVMWIDNSGLMQLQKAADVVED